MKELKGKKVAVLGLGIENLPLTKFLIKKGAEVAVCDKDKKIKKIKGVKEWRLGKDYLKNLTDFEIVFRTPGISRFAPELVEADLKGVEISSQTKLFFDLCPAKIIGVTGTKGKGTCAALIYEILRSATDSLLKRTPPSTRSAPLRSPWSPLMRDESVASRPKIYLAGNIGNPPVQYLEKIKPSDWVILELSSFQLQDLEKSPQIAVVLDISYDHLDYHQSIKEYVQAKKNIVKYQTKKDFAVINLDYLTSYKFASATLGKVFWFSRKKSVEEGCFVRWRVIKDGKRIGRFGEVILRVEGKDHLICPTYEIDLIGLHNLENICAAIIACHLARAKIKDIQKVVTTFSGLEHRLELVAEINGVKYVNDSFSTTPETACAALESFPEPVILIAGGRSKGGDYDKLAKTIVKSSVKSLILIGEMAQEIERKLPPSSRLRRASKIKNLGKANMRKIVKTAQEQAEPGDTVLLSPGCASFDMFKNASDRGKQFKKAVKSLRSRK